MRRFLTVVVPVCYSVLAAFLLLELTIRAFALFEEARRDLAEQTAGFASQRPSTNERLATTLLHPYRGWMRSPGSVSFFRAGELPVFPTGEISSWSQKQTRANELGYFSALEDYRLVGPDSFVVGVFGGSVASNLSTIGGAALREAIAKRMARPVESVSILNFGSGAYRQPQQLMALIEAVLLGIRLDLVLNLDGYNEIVLGSKDARNGHHPYLPSYRHWAGTAALLGDDPSARRVDLTYHLLEARRHERTAAQWLGAGGVATRSALVASVVALWAQRARIRATVLENELQEKTLEEASDAALASLGASCLGTDDECRERIVQLWLDSSRLMDRVAGETGAFYVHALQPNQYLPNSKRLSAEEERHAVQVGANARRVASGYPLLIEAAASLRRAGIVFLDMTAVFSGDERTLYRDRCCHMNQRGNELLAAAIVRALPPEALEATRGEHIEVPEPSK